MDREISLKLKEWGTYRVTPMGAFLFTENKFKIFVPNKILDKINSTRFFKDKLKSP